MLEIEMLKVGIPMMLGVNFLAIKIEYLTNIFKDTSTNDIESILFLIQQNL